MGLNFTTECNEPSLFEAMQSQERKMLYNLINCCRVGIVQSYDNENRIAKVKIANKLTTEVNNDGSVVSRDYAPIYAKVFFLGWGESGITCPIVEAESNEDGKGSEGLLLFSDREIESWYINGGVNNIKYTRAHDKTDAIFLTGIHSLPNMVTAFNDRINIYYGDCNVQVLPTGVIINGDTTINGSLTVTGDITATGDVTAGGISLMEHVHGNGNDGADTTAPK